MIRSTKFLILRKKEYKMLSIKQKQISKPQFNIRNFERSQASEFHTFKRVLSPPSKITQIRII
jgi:hypothetical protein